jgi:hypothetical protein
MAWSRRKMRFSSPIKRAQVGDDGCLPLSDSVSHTNSRLLRWTAVTIGYPHRGNPRVETPSQSVLDVTLLWTVASETRVQVPGSSETEEWKQCRT